MPQPNPPSSSSSSGDRPRHTASSHPYASSSDIYQVTATTTTTTTTTSASTRAALAAAASSSSSSKKRKRAEKGKKKRKKKRAAGAPSPASPSASSSSSSLLPARPPTPPPPKHKRHSSPSPLPLSLPAPPPPPSTKGKPNPEMRTTTRPSYQATASLAALQARSQTPLPITLLLDLNGTLLLRKERKTTSSIAPTHRPYLRSFLLYALGAPSQHEEALARTAHIDRSILHTLTDWPSPPANMDKKARLRKREAVSRLHALSQDLQLDLSADNLIHNDDNDADQQQQLTRDEEHDQHGPWTPFGPASSARPSNPAALKPRLHVIIWSSAKPDNVQRMIRSVCLPSWKSTDLETRTKLVPSVGAGPNADSSLALLTRIQHIWGRDTLIPIDSHAYNLKVQCIKDLEIVWWALNYEAAAARDPAHQSQISLWKSGHAASLAARSTRLFAGERVRQDWARPDEDGLDWAPAFSTTSPAQSTEPLPSPTSSSENVSEMLTTGAAAKEEDAPLPKIGRTKGTGSAAAEAAYLANKLGPWSAKNTLLLDDTPAKAALQPFNHLCVPVFNEQAANIAKEFREQIAYELENNAVPDPSDKSKLSAWNQDVRLLLNRPRAAAKLDNVLLQLIGVLDEARHQPNVAAWIRAGGLQGFGGQSFQPRDAQEAQVREQFGWDSPQTAQGWAARGRSVLQNLGLPLLV